MTEWVAVATFFDEQAWRLRENGAIYSDKPDCNGMEGSRILKADEHEVVCPRCGQRFVSEEKSTAEENRDLHFDGDDDIPSICPNVPVARA